ncbi:mechanosensitive ion channel family protein [Halonotius terrestris]|uniref:Mechanosensitive ion channel family protein n=1 Tax=Halonotius terrestris TaxID=2487750 RepID=A0A8J8PB28_9EURY|nr:mechanosensitive ion channel family protein [Halonotius terrestris]TQQ83021.1 mechanosensitive ion channel family protein [Halonotius terrestris]
MVSSGLLQVVEEPAPEVAGLLPAWLQFPGYRIVAALLVVAVGVSLSNLLVRLLGRPIARRFDRQSVAQTVLGGIRGLTVVMTLVVAGSLVGLQLSNIVLSVTVFSAVVGIILAPIVGNVLNGVFVLADQPYEIGDMIELDEGTRGFVDDITIRYTKIFTLDNTFLVIPNGNIRERDVTNYSAEDERTRLSVDVLVTYESDISEARRLMEAACRDTETVIKGGPDIRIGSARYPAAPRCYIADYGDNGVLLRLRFWVTKPYNLLTVESGVRTEIRKRFADADATAEMAYPHRQLVFDETSKSQLPMHETDGDPRVPDADSGGVHPEMDESPATTDATDDTQE